MRKILVCIVIGIFPISIFAQKSFTNDIAFYAYHKINNIKLTVEETEKFIKRYHNDELKKKVSDEFEYKDYIGKKTIQYQNCIDTLNLSNHYLNMKKVRFGEYDFTNKGFPLIYDDDFSKGNINPVDGYNVEYNYIAKAVNLDKFKFLQMEPDKAKELINQFKIKGNKLRLCMFYNEFYLNGKTDKFYDDQIYWMIRFTGFALCEIVELEILILGTKSIKIKN